jgi:DNA transformation protein
MAMFPELPLLLFDFAPFSFAFGCGVTGRDFCVKSFAAMADDSFKEFVLDQLSALPDVRARAMFGAHGLYQGESFFAILDEGRLFFKTDTLSQADYIARGMGPFTYEMKGRVMTMGYHEVPPDVLENREELVAWAHRAIQIAARGEKSPKLSRPNRVPRKSARS